ncbi:hypothetical protein F5878DRAFT_450049 [Lentinula raphanica]|uniref:Uncharacterized protein n=1 Tax=Lentinula raphanica TaxID=153919 RepID=A0AA38U5K9_9AGAR|nr:hypothetical protein F5878DRAFT_450049 [Lentinula raphanica]
MSIVLPPMPEPSNLSPPASRVNPRTRPINKIQSLQRHMKEAQAHMFTHGAIPAFPISLSSLSSSQPRAAKKQESRQLGKSTIHEIIKTKMEWGDDLFWKTSTSITMNYGFQLWLRKLQAKGTSPALIRNQFETFLVLIGQQHEDLDLSRLSAGISFCLSYFGEIYIRWQPNKDCDDPDEAVFRTANLVYTDYLPMSTSEPPVPLGDSSLKRKRKHADDGPIDGSDQIQRPVIKLRRVIHRGSRTSTTLTKNETGASGASNLAVTGKTKSDLINKPTRSLKDRLKQAVVEVVRTRT